MKPEFVDNRNGNTLVAALRGHLDWLASTYARPIELAIASGYFNPEGLRFAGRPPRTAAQGAAAAGCRANAAPCPAGPQDRRIAGPVRRPRGPRSPTRQRCRAAAGPESAGVRPGDRGRHPPAAGAVGVRHGRSPPLREGVPPRQGVHLRRRRGSCRRVQQLHGRRADEQPGIEPRPLRSHARAAGEAVVRRPLGRGPAVRPGGDLRTAIRRSPALPDLLARALGVVRAGIAGGAVQRPCYSADFVPERRPVASPANPGPVQRRAVRRWRGPGQDLRCRRVDPGGRARPAAAGAVDLAGGTARRDVETVFRRAPALPGECLLRGTS